MDKKQIELYIRNLKNGDTSAAEPLYRLLVPKLYAVTYSVLKDKHDAEDIAHDTFVQVYNHIHTYTFTGDTCACICTIAYNKAINHYNKHKRVQTHDPMERTDSVNPHETVEGQVQQKLLMEAALSHLDQSERYIVLWHIRDGLKHAETAQILQVPLNTVLSKYRRSLKKMRAFLNSL